MSRPLEDCEGRPALAGVRNLGLDDPSAGCSDLHCNFGVRSIWARRAAAARRAGSLKRGCTGRTVRRAESGACGVRGTRWRSCGDGARSWQATQAWVRRPWLVVDLERGRDEQAATRRGAPLQPALEQRPDPGLTARGLEGGVAHFGSKKCPILDDPNPGRPDSHCNFGGVGPSAAKSFRNSRSVVRGDA